MNFFKSYFKKDLKIILYITLNNMKEYFGFDILKKDSNLEGKLVEMSPKEFIQNTMPKATFHEIESYIDKNKAVKYSDKMKQGEKFPIPYLINYSNYTLHEGKHRAYAAMILETTIIPVYIIDKTDTIFFLWK